MKVLGIDPGTRVCGYGVIECSGGEPHMLDYGVLQSRDASVSARLKTIYDGLVEVIERLGPDVAAVETAFFGKNVRSALRIGEGRGVALLAAASRGLTVAEYSPAEVKKAVVGTGRAGKWQVQQMVRVLLHIAAEELPEDAADALAIAICHSHRMPAEEL
ncbi:MAG: crossover junction endodeoxyribonuclease RuvC [Candidatus Brocadiae bacterium]|nr:crossover junction endodeoxyribonuclease RuvC [Candidatus Brocadiia bacterium]